MLRILKSILVFFAAIIILFEEWLWDPLSRLMKAFGRLPLISRLSRRIAALPPHQALFTYLLPMAVLLPFKIIGLWLIARHQAVLGIFTFLAAKIAGTALFAWLFGLTRPALMKIAWFARAYGVVQRISAIAHAWIHRQPLYCWVKQMIRDVRHFLRRMSDP